MERRSLNAAWNWANKPEVQDAIVARILHQQDSEPWKRSLDAHLSQLGERARRDAADFAWRMAHPWQAWVRDLYRRFLQH